jgi:hypothetical protein
MYKIVVRSRTTGDVFEDFKGIQSFTIAKKIGLLLASHDVSVNMNQCDDETGEVIKENINIFRDW